MYVTTKVLSNGPEKDPSGSDQLYTNIRLQWDGIINPQLPGLTGVNAGDTLARIRHRLTAPRRPLYYDLTSLPGQRAAGAVLDIPDGRDDGGGPWPDADAFTARYVTPQTVEVSWSCMVRLRDCPAGGSTADEPLSIRWEDSLTWDKYFKATFRRSGTCVISSRSVDKMDYVRRTKLSPAVPPGFARTSAHYVVSRDGLRCDFQFTDEQLRYAPPYPCVDMEIRQSESTSKHGVGMRLGEVYVTMTGVQNANPVDLQRWALTVASARVFAARPFQSNRTGAVLGQVVFSTQESKDSVGCSVSVSYKVPPTGFRQSGAAAGTGWPAAGIAGFFSNPTPQNTQQGRNRAAVAAEYPWVGFGTSVPSPTNPTGFAKWANPSGAVVAPAEGVGLAESVGLFAALLQDPCGQKMEVNPYATNVNTLTASVGPIQFDSPAAGQGGTPAVVQSTVSAVLSSLAATQYPSTVGGGDANAVFVWDGLPGAYDYWQCENEYSEDPGMLVIPTCDPNGKNIKVGSNSKMITLIKRWAAARAGAPPALPPRQHPDPNWVYVGGSKSPREEMVEGDGVSAYYAAAGWYEYQCLDSTKVNTAAEVPPFLSPLAFGVFGQLWADDISQNTLAAQAAAPGGNPAGGGGLPMLF